MERNELQVFENETFKVVISKKPAVITTKEQEETNTSVEEQ